MKISLSVFALLCFALAATANAADFTTPVAALKSLEEAYQHKDIDAAVAAKDFNFEAMVLLRSMGGTSNPDTKLIEQTAQTLELAFRKEIQTGGFPDFGQLRCTIVKESQLMPKLVEMIEECIFPDGEKSSDKLHAFNNGQGWHIVILPE